MEEEGETLENKTRAHAYIPRLQSAKATLAAPTHDIPPFRISSDTASARSMPAASAAARTQSRLACTASLSSSSPHTKGCVTMLAAASLKMVSSSMDEGEGGGVKRDREIAVLKGRKHIQTEIAPPN